MMLLGRQKLRGLIRGMHQLQEHIKRAVVLKGNELDTDKVFGVYTTVDTEKVFGVYTMVGTEKVFGVYTMVDSENVFSLCSFNKWRQTGYVLCTTLFSFALS